jgi:hypothetical protein
MNNLSNSSRLLAIILTGFLLAVAVGLLSSCDTASASGKRAVKKAEVNRTKLARLMPVIRLTSTYPVTYYVTDSSVIIRRVDTLARVGDIIDYEGVPFRVLN